MYIYIYICMYMYMHVYIYIYYICMPFPRPPTCRAILGPSTAARSAQASARRLPGYANDQNTPRRHRNLSNRQHVAMPLCHADAMYLARGLCGWAKGRCWVSGLGGPCDHSRAWDLLRPALTCHQAAAASPPPAASPARAKKGGA